MLNYLLFSIFSAFTAGVLIFFKILVESITDVIFFCCKNGFLNNAPKELFIKLSNAQECKNGVVECLTVIMAGFLYSLGDFVFLSGRLRLIPLFLIIILYFLFSKLSLKIKSFFKGIIALIVTFIALPISFMSAFMKKILKNA